MIDVKRSQPPPSCLAEEKKKKTGDYKCGEVMERLREDFWNKCYICEDKELTSINVEHLRPHENNNRKKFDWNNLCWSCGHCNNIKSNKYKKIWDCTDPNVNIEEKITCRLLPYPAERVEVSALDASFETEETASLLNAIYDGTTKQKRMEAASLRTRILEEIEIFYELLENIDKDESPYYLGKLKNHLQRSSKFSGFKRRIIMDDPRLKEKYSKYLT